MHQVHYLFISAFIFVVPPHFWHAEHPSLTLKHIDSRLILEDPGLTTLRASRVAHDLTLITVCVCDFPTQCVASVINVGCELGGTMTGMDNELAMGWKFRVAVKVGPMPKG